MAPSVQNIEPGQQKGGEQRDEVSGLNESQMFKQKFSKDKTKIADVFELPITVVNNVLY